MKQLFKAAIGTTLLFATANVFAAERVYVAPVKSGEHPCVVPLPRDSWYAKVQRKFDRYGNNSTMSSSTAIPSPTAGRWPAKSMEREFR